MAAAPSSFGTFIKRVNNVCSVAEALCERHSPQNEPPVNFAIIEHAFQGLQIELQRESAHVQHEGRRRLADLRGRIDSLITVHGAPAAAAARAAPNRPAPAAAAARAPAPDRPAPAANSRDVAAELIGECARIEQALSSPTADLDAIASDLTALQERALRLEDRKAGEALGIQIQALHNRIQRSRTLTPQGSNDVGRAEAPCSSATLPPPPYSEAVAGSSRVSEGQPVGAPLSGAAQEVYHWTPPGGLAGIPQETLDTVAFLAALPSYSEVVAGSSRVLEGQPVGTPLSGAAQEVYYWIPPERLDGFSRDSLDDCMGFGAFGIWFAHGSNSSAQCRFMGFTTRLPQFCGREAFESVRLTKSQRDQVIRLTSVPGTVRRKTSLHQVLDLFEPCRTALSGRVSRSANCAGLVVLLPPLPTEARGAAPAAAQPLLPAAGEAPPPAYEASPPAYFPAAAPPPADDMLTRVPQEVRSVLDMRQAAEVIIRSPIDVGYGNTLYMRGEPVIPGMSWETEVPMTHENGGWVLRATVTRPFEYKFGTRSGDGVFHWEDYNGNRRYPG